MVQSNEAYIPDLEKIAEHSKNPEPVMLSPREYNQILDQYGLYRGTRLSDVGILKAMEAGLIKIWDEEGMFNLLEQIQGARVDLRLGHQFWHYVQHKISRLTLGRHQRVLEELDVLAYNFKVAGDVFVFHPHSLVLGLTQEGISLSNVVVADIDGRSSTGRLGLSNHQTAGEIGPGFAGCIMLELSNVIQTDVAVPIHERIGAIGFSLLDQPSSRPYNMKPDSLAHMQTAPFRFWSPQWDEVKRRAVAAGLVSSGNGYHVTGDPSGGS